MCENSDQSKNRYGLMCYNNGKRSMCKMTDEEARKEAKRRLRAYQRPTLAAAMHKYSPPIENNTQRHIKCIEQYSGVSSLLKFNN